MAFPNITPLPAAPNPDNPASFNTLAYPYTVAYRDSVPEFNAFINMLNSTYWPNTPVRSMIDGTAAAPAWTWDTDPDTGIFRPAANTIGFSTGGTERLRITSAGLLTSATAIVTSASDTTAGRLLTTGAGPAQAFRRGNILGTVSMSAGIPTGAVIQAGSNANGTFIKFADGTMICWGSNTVSDVTTPAGSLFTTASDLTWTYPAEFTSGIRMFWGARNSGHVVGAAGRGTPSSTAATYRPWSSGSSSTGFVVNMMIYGFWN